jgi:hypothetical protein
VATVHHLKKSNLRVTRQVDILCAIGNKLHKTTTCHLYTPSEEIILWNSRKTLESPKNTGLAGGMDAELPRKDARAGEIFFYPNLTHAISFKSLNKGYNQL